VALREILASFGYEIDHAELSKGEAGISHMVESIGSLGRHVAEAFAAYEIKEFVQRTIEGALELKHAAVIAGTSAQALQELRYAAEVSEVPVEALSMGLMRLQRSMFASGAGAMGAGAAFKVLGLNQKDLAKMDSTEAFTAVAEAISKIQNPAEQTALAMKMFGRGGAQLLPLLKKGSEGIAELRGEVTKLGGGFSQEYIEKAEKAHEASVKLSMTWRSLSVLLTDKLVPALTWITSKAAEFVQGLDHMNEGVNISRVGLAAFVAVGVAGLSQLIPLVGAFALRSALPIIGWLALGLAIEDIIALFEGDHSLTGSLIDKFFGEGSASMFVQDVTAMTATWQNFKDALAAFAGTAGASFIGWIVDQTKYWANLIEYALKFVNLLGRAQSLISGESTEDYNRRVAGEYHGANAQVAETSAQREDANRASYRAEFDRIRDAAATAKIVSGREAQLNQSRPVEGGMLLGPGVGMPVPQNVPAYMTSPKYYIDKSSTVVQTMPGTTDGQSKAIGSAVAKARRESSDYRAAAAALEPAVEVD
jgi:hypothetical protein